MGLTGFEINTGQDVIPLSTVSILELEEYGDYSISCKSADAECLILLGEKLLHQERGKWAFSVGHWIGDSKLTIETNGDIHRIPVRVKPREKKLADELWVTILQDLEAWLPGVTVGIEGGRSGGVGKKGVTAPFIAEALVPLVPALCEAFEVLVRNLREIDVLKWEDVPLRMMRRVDRQTLKWVSRHPDVAASLDPWKSLETQPPLLPRLVAEDVIDHPANRYIAWLIHQVASRLSSAATALRSAGEGNSTTDDAVEWCMSRASGLTTGATLLRKTLSTSPLARLQREPATEAAYQVVIDDPIYARVQKLSRLFLNPLFTLEPQEDALQAAVRPSFSIYEIWCFLAVIRQMKTLLGNWEWKFHRIEHLLNLSGSGEGASASAYSGIGKLDIRFNQTFSGYFNREGKNRWSLSKERRPDIVVCYRATDAGPDNGVWLCLDAKYRVGRSNLGDAFESIHIYKDSLRYDGYGGKCSSCVLLSPSQADDSSDWYLESFIKQHGAGVWKLRPGESGAALALWICRELGMI